MSWLNLSDHVNLLSLIGALLIILITLFVVGKIFRQMKTARSEAELSELSWDGIAEYKNPVPTGWAVIFVLVIVWAIWYFLWGYPLGSFSRIGEYNAELAAHNAKFEEKFKNLSEADKVAMGQNIFLVQCSICHGITADGMDGKAQNLNVWGSEAAIEDVIKKGSKGMNFPGGEMPAGADLGVSDEDAKAIAAYVAKEVSAIKFTANEDLVAKGKEAFATCATCHGEDGKGMEGNFPDLTKYGSFAFVKDVLTQGKAGSIGTMPQFPGLNEIQKEAVGSYVISLSKPNSGARQ